MWATRFLKTAASVWKEFFLRAKKIDRVVKEAAKKEHSCKISPQIDSAAAKEWILKICCQEFPVQPWNFLGKVTVTTRYRMGDAKKKEIVKKSSSSWLPHPLLQREKLPCPKTPSPWTRRQKSDVRCEPKRDASWKKYVLIADFAFPAQNPKQMLASIPAQTSTLAQHFAVCLCCQNSNEVCLEFERGKLCFPGTLWNCMEHRPFPPSLVHQRRLYLPPDRYCY